MPPSPFEQGFRDALALFSAGRLADAENAAAALTAAHPDAALGFNLLGVIQAGRGKAEAAGQFRRAVALDPEWDEPQGNLGLMLCQGKDLAAAAACFRTALHLNPANAAAALNLGNTLRERGEREEAAALYRHAVTIPGPHEALAHNNLGAVLLDAGQVDEAAACFRRAITLQSGFADAHLNLGRALRRRGKLEEALESLMRARDLAPASGEAAVVLAGALRDLGRTDDAVRAYGSAMTLAPGNREASHNLGLCLNDLGRHGEGLAAIAQGVGIARLAVAPDAGPAPRRANLDAGAIPHFIGVWFMERPEICDRIIDVFENHGADHAAGRSARGLDASVKNSTDLTVLPCDLDKPAFAPVAAYLKELEACVGDYARQWPIFGDMLQHVDLVPFTIQRYRDGGHFQRVHAERMSFGYIHRVLAWMTYLNDVDAGGETTFSHYGISVRPERGKTLIWPAEWTHAHAGNIVKAGSKYIITGWMHFPPPKADSSGNSL